jgi:hypothetical protein
MVANRYMVDRVFVEQTGFVGARLGLWTVRRLGWVLVIQPTLYGLILLSRREWSLGGASLGVGVAVIGLSELLTVTFHRRTKENSVFGSTPIALGKIERDIAIARDCSLMPRAAEDTLLDRVTEYLPRLSRLPPDCPLPLQTETIDDLTHTERACFALASMEGITPRGTAEEESAFFHDPGQSYRGLVYPPEMLAPAEPVVWLPRDEGGIAMSEANHLMAYHGIAAIVDDGGFRFREEKVKFRNKRRDVDKRMEERDSG